MGSRYDEGPAGERVVRARSSAEEHYLDMVGVTGSIPVAPTNKRPGNQQLQWLLLRQACLVLPEQATNDAQKPDRIGQMSGNVFAQGSRTSARPQ
jgi:hypothetical protein